MKEQLTSDEIRMADRIAEGMRRRVGGSLAVTVAKMVKILKGEGFQASDVKVRKAIRFLRIERSMFICADHRGFYLAASAEERTHEIASLRSRENEIREVREALEKQDLDARRRQQVSMGF